MELTELLSLKVIGEVLGGCDVNWLLENDASKVVVLSLDSKREIIVALIICPDSFQDSP